MTGRRRCDITGGAVAAILALTGAAGRAVAQGEEPITVQQQKQLRGLHLNRPWASAELSALYSRTESESAAGEKSVSEQVAFRTIADLGVDGHYGHPDLLKFEVSGRLDYSHRDLQRDTLANEGVSEDTLLGYDIELEALRRRPLSFLAMARQDRTFLDREFGGMIESTTTQWGATARLREVMLPSTLSFTHIETENDGEDEFSDYSSEQNVLELLGGGVFGPRQQVNYSYRFSDLSEWQGQSGARDYQRHDASISHTYFLSEFGADTLRSYLNLQHQSGAYALDRVNWSEHLWLRHSDTVRTNHNYDFQYLDRSSVTQTSHSWRSLIEHQLFESLTSTGTAFARTEDVSTGFDQQEYGVRADFDYRKFVPYGQLHSAVSGQLSRQENSAAGDGLLILDQRFVISDVQPIVLDQPRVETGSIVITSEDRSRTYVSGVDYLVVELPDRTEIRRVVGGAIPDGSAVLVSYTIAPEPANTIDTTSYSASVRYLISEGLLSGLSPYARYIVNEASIDADESVEFRPPDRTEFVVGTDYTAGKVTLTAEHKRVDAFDSNSNENLLRAQYAGSIGATGYYSLSANYRTIDYDQDIGDFDVFRVDALLGADLTKRWRVLSETRYRHEDDAIRGTVQGFEQELEVRWRYRQTEVYNKIRFAVLESDQSDSMSQSYLVGLKRRF